MKFDVDYTADLARLELSTEEKELFQSQLGQVLDYVQQLEKVNVDGIEPTAHTHPVENVLRNDEATNPANAEAALKNAPHAGNGLFMVTKVVE